jgi:hypothetical protein
VIVVVSINIYHVKTMYGLLFNRVNIMFGRLHGDFVVIDIDAEPFVQSSTGGPVPISTIFYSDSKGCLFSCSPT